MSTLSTQFFLTDLLGSVLTAFSATAGSAVVLGNQLYGPYGNQQYSKGTMGTTKGYTGQYADVTGLDYYNARYYDPVVGRFLSVDTEEGNVQGMDPYAYVMGNPETHTDSSGHSNDPTLAYVYLWYTDYHQGDTVYADVPGANHFQGGIKPDIANKDAGGIPDNNVMWEAKSGAPGFFFSKGLPGTDTVGVQNATAWPANEAVATADAQAELMTNQYALWFTKQGWYQAGTFQNDQGVADFFNEDPACDGRGAGATCLYQFADDSLMEIKNPSAAGVLIYRIVKSGSPEYAPLDQFYKTALSAAAIIAAVKAAIKGKNTGGGQGKPGLAMQTWTVTSGQSLSSIAFQVYGSYSAWTKLYNDNKNIIGSNPNLIYSGQQLKYSA